MNSDLFLQDYIKYNRVYDEKIEKQLQLEFARLKDQIYLEHAGATLYSDKQIQSILNDYQCNLYGNPHALSTSSRLSEDTIDQIRFRILNHFNTNSDEYSLVFTSGATNALKIIAEYFNFSGNSCDNDKGILTYSQDNHTSVLGMREYVDTFKCLSNQQLNEIFLNYSVESTNRVSDDTNETSTTNSLFIYPAQSNFSGQKYPLEWIEQIQNSTYLNKIFNTNSKWFCMLDAACYISTSELDLSKFKPDFVCLSFYKIFGYPTGLGALLVKNSSTHTLRKTYFGGGTVQISLSSEKFRIFRDSLHESFEDGTLPFLSIIALQHCFNYLEQLSLNMKLISQHVFSLAQYVHHSLSVFHHSNGHPVAVLYSNNNFEDIDRQGGIVNFNLLRENGQFVGFSEVLHMANLYNIHLRTGCFCNPGACQQFLNLTNAEVKKHFEAGHVCGDQHDLIDGVPTGSIRVSFGYMSLKKDADVLLKMIVECFVKKPLIQKIPKSIGKNQRCSNLNGTLKTPKDANFYEDIQNRELENEFKLLNIFIYPIKSCGAFSISQKWQLSNTGLKYDREWMIVNHSGVCLTQKQEIKMCLIKPIIDLEQNCLILTFPGLPKISIPLEENVTNSEEITLCQTKVCRDQVECSDCGVDVAKWLDIALDRTGLRLLRQNSNRISKKVVNGDKSTKLSLANEAQFLLLNIRSIEWLQNLITDKSCRFTIENLIARFRPNLVIRAGEAFDELSYSELTINNHYFKCVGPCTRCQMICIDQETGNKTIEPLKTLAGASNGKVRFGIYLKCCITTVDNNYLNIGDSVAVS